MYQLGSLQRKLVTMIVNLVTIIVKLVTMIVKYNYVNLTIELNDVTKQKNDWSQFYWNILDKKSNSKTEIKVKTKEDKQSIKTIELSQDVEDDALNNVIDNVVDNEESRELSSDLSPEHDDKQLKVDHSDNLPESAASVVEESQRRRCLLTNEDTAMSAKERYLVRKRAKLSQPTISTDDPLNL